MKKAIQTLFLLLFLFPIAGNAQAPRKPIVVERPKEEWRYMLNHEKYCEEFGPFAAQFGYGRTRFLTQPFYDGKAAGTIGYGGMGGEVALSYTAFYPFFADFYVFYTSYKLPATEGKKDAFIDHIGVGLFANVFVLPYIEWLSPWFHPYVGIGYQTSRLAGTDSKAGTGSLMGQAGARFHIIERLYLYAEYKQGLPTGSDKLFRGICFGLGCTFSGRN